MALSVSALVLFGVMLIIFIRGKQIKMPHAIVAVLFGFMLNQSTQLSKPIQEMLNSVANTLGNVTK
ncbi:hypothetical protein [Kitasatospora viridis]|uniref:Uncharacterized protein n=1 Tax=Kitasatospora viridis TaxID=281105 RepID=A0A561UKZ9_9ACTN|nr:hypothetical protein [Kitasatospora viridis]TWG00027.1 hypothetical protein FHX73_113891 [Kitasatospora viridis]